MRHFTIFHLLLTLLVADERLVKITLPNTPTENFLSISNDSSNFFWIGTDQGLIRYDGINSDVFRSNPFSPKSLSGNRVWFLDNYNNDTLLMSENVSYFEQRRTFTASQTYTQNLTNPTYNTAFRHRQITS